MERQIIPPKTDPETQSLLKGIMDGALNVPIIFTDTEPTTSNQILKEGLLAFYIGNLYLTLQGTTYKIALTIV